MRVRPGPRVKEPANAYLDLRAQQKCNTSSDDSKQTQFNSSCIPIACRAKDIRELISSLVATTSLSPRHFSGIALFRLLRTEIRK